MLIQMNLSEEEIRALGYKRFRALNPMIQKRLHAVYLKAKLGLSNAFIGEVPDARRNSVDTWIAGYREGGLKGLTTLNYRKRESELACYGEEIKSKFSEEMIPSVATFSQKKRKKENAGCFFVMRRILQRFFY
jgi:hypothetical protein